MKRRSPFLVLTVLLALLAAACGGDDAGTSTDAGNGTTTTAADGGSITVYSGRSEELVGPIIERFEEETGITVEVRYGDTAEMAATILEEGSNSPADVFFGQDAGALGALSSAGRLQTLDDDLLDQVDEQFRSPDGEWIGLSGRARTVVYNTDALSEDDLPDSILDFTDPEWSGRLGWAPTNGSFQAFVTALRVLEGEDGARSWLEGIQANDVQVYEKNSAIVEAVASGEIEAGFVNHYYLYRFLAEDPDFPAANKFYTDGDPGALINIAGAGIVDTAANPDAASRFIEFLLSDEGQEYFAAETFELPLVDGVEPAVELPDLEALRQPAIDLDQLEDLDGTLRLLTEVGLI
ncbi:MAG TPA: iron ABC transporter substrate-binding protein [Acidimicrobiales bacterium]|nr:iron ABC transporter substrate-binding protein [Acidimicrobiales bacterium]